MSDYLTNLFQSANALFFFPIDKDEFSCHGFFPQVHNNTVCCKRKRPHLHLPLHCLFFLLLLGILQQRNLWSQFSQLCSLKEQHLPLRFTVLIFTHTDIFHLFSTSVIRTVFLTTDQVLLVLHLALWLLQQCQLGVLRTLEVSLQPLSLLLSSLSLLLQLHSLLCLLLQFCSARTHSQTHTNRSTKGKHHVRVLQLIRSPQQTYLEFCQVYPPCWAFFVCSSICFNLSINSSFSLSIFSFSFSATSLFLFSFSSRALEKKESLMRWITICTSLHT